MTEAELVALSDEELLAEAEKRQQGAWIYALFIGIMVGVIVWSVIKSTVGLLTLIPLYFIYRMLKRPDERKILQAEIAKRGLA